jgi:hypothetical protein
MNVSPHDKPLLVRIHLTDSSIECFIRADSSNAQATFQSIDPARLFGQSRLIVAGRLSKSVFIPSEINRIDFAWKGYVSCKLPEGYSDIVELCESDFRKRAHLEEPEKMPEREQAIVVGDLIVSFLKLRFMGGLQVFLMTERSARLPVENQAFMRLLLSRNHFPMRLRSGGVAYLNLANLLSYTVYPGSPQAPSDSWIAEPTSCNPLDCVDSLQIPND